MKNILFTIFLLIPTLNLFAQDYIASMKVNQLDDKLVIEYELDKVDIDDVYFIVNLELYYGGLLIKPSRQNISGPLSFNDQDKISNSGIAKKKIIWDLLKEPGIKDIDGDINVILRAKLFGKVLAGPEASIFSVLVPGLGQYRVRENKKPYIIAAPVAYGGIAAGILLRNKSQESLNMSLSASNQDEIERFEDQSNDEILGSNIAFGIGAAVWLGDIIIVAIKGSKNKKSISRYSYDSKRIKIRPHIDSDRVVGNTTFGVVLDF